MVNQELIDWISNAKDKGYTKDRLKEMLLSNNYEEDVIDESLNVVFAQNDISTVNVDKPIVKKKKNSSRILFIFLGIFLFFIVLIIGGAFFVLNSVGDININKSYSANISGEHSFNYEKNFTSNSINGEVLVEFSEFGLDESFGDKLWRMNVSVINNDDGLVYYSLSGLGDNWVFSSDGILKPQEEDVANFDIDHYFFDDLAYDKKNLSILIYECDKLSVEDSSQLCVTEYGFDGIKSPFEVIQDRRFAKNPIEPTRVVTKFYDFNSVEVAPKEISEIEFLN